MGFFGWAIVAGLLALWFWWMERRQAAAMRQLSARAKERAAAPDEDDDEEDNEDYERRRRRLRLARMPLHALAVVFGWAAAVFFVLSFFRTVSSGTVAVPVTFGKASKQVGPGLHVEWPITVMRTISVRTQSYTMAPNGDDPSTQVLGSEGTVAGADSTLLFRVSRKQATKLYDTVGTGYVTTIVKPSARTCVRENFARLPLLTAATTRFDAVETAIDACIRQKLAGTAIGVVDFQLRELRLSKQLQNSLDGIAAARMLGITNPLDTRYLQYYYEQILSQFATSPGSSLVITPPNGTGLTVNVPNTPSTTTTTTGR
jgi:SPFH domain / Band 7 family